MLSSLKVDGNAVNTVLSYTITNVQKDTTITAEFSPISYTISYDLDGGTGSNPTSYTIETESFTLNEPTREGYTFTGWTGSNGTTAQKEVTINKGSTGNRNYTANWEANNVAPTTPTVTTSNKTTSSFVVSAVSTDTDGGSLTYTLYVEGSAKETKTASSGTTVTFSTVTGLSEYTTYSYYVTVTDGKDSTTSSTGSIRTKCSGGNCTGTIRSSTCSSCKGNGHAYCRGTFSTVNDFAVWCSTCKEYNTNSTTSQCSSCKNYVQWYHHTDCGNGFYGFSTTLKKISGGYSIGDFYLEKKFNASYCSFSDLDDWPDIRYHKEECSTCDSTGTIYECSTCSKTFTSNVTQHCSHGYSVEHD